MMLESLSMPRICCSTTSCRAWYSCADLFTALRKPSRCEPAVASAWCSFASALSLAALSLCRISTSFLRILSRSRISAAPGCELWMAEAKLLRSLLARS